jgi:hypothetical protein
MTMDKNVVMNYMNSAFSLQEKLTLDDFEIRYMSQTGGYLYTVVANNHQFVPWILTEITYREAIIPISREYSLKQILSDEVK